MTAATGRAAGRAMRAAVVGMAALVASLAGRAQDAATDNAADMVLRHGTVYTVDAHDTVAQAIAVRAGHIVYVGNDAGAGRYIGASTQVIDLDGRMLMPGLVDGHMHPLQGGALLTTCYLDYAPLTAEQFAARIQACVDKDGEGAAPVETKAGASTTPVAPPRWLRVTAWYRQFMLPPGTDANAALLDTVKTTRPIIVESSDGHSLVANTRALELAEITAATPDVADGRIWRDAAGKPTGVFEDGAERLIARVVPAPGAAENLQAARAALDALRRQGVTSFLDAAAGEDSIQAFSAVAAEGGLTARAHFAPVIEAKDGTDPAAVVASLKAIIAKYDAGPLAPKPGITVRNAKIFMDGVLQAPAQTAVLMKPYRVNQGTSDHPHWVAGTKTGEVYFPSEELNPLLVALAQAGIEPHIHAIGDRAVHQALDAIEVMRNAVPDADLRAAIAHCELVDPADYRRFARLDAIPVMSYQWAKPGPDSIDGARDYLGPARFARMEPEGSLYDAHARIAYGSDWPVDRLGEWFALKVGITRTGDPALGPKYAGRLNAERRLPRPFALRSITMNASYELHQDEQTGSLEPGKLADLIVLDRDFLTVPAEDIANTTVLLTMVGGNVVYRAAGF